MNAKTPKLSGVDRFQPADFSIQRFAARVPADITLDDVLHPEYFANHIDRMKPGMEITVLSEDNKLDARLRVLSVTKTTASLRVLDDYSNADETNGKKAKAKAPADAKADDGGAGKVSMDDIKVNHGGPHHMWRFIHSDKVIEHGFATQADATAAAEKYVEKANG